MYSEYVAGNSQKETFISLLFSHFFFFFLSQCSFLIFHTTLLLLTTTLHNSVASTKHESLTHKTTESIKRSWDPGLRINFN